jgi:hypothetical protein
VTVLAAHAWPTNGDLIADVARLGYLRDTDHVLDPTPGDAAVWWKTWRPDDLVILPEGSDFRRLPYGDACFDAVAFDPPYVCTGGRETSGMKSMYERYGILDHPRTPEEVQQLINDGLTEMARVVKPSATRAMCIYRPNGIVLVKCQSYVWSGRHWPGKYLTLEHALGLGLVLEDEFTFLGGVRPQPARSRSDGQPSRQHHARNNTSTLFVLRRVR